MQGVVDLQSTYKKQLDTVGTANTAEDQALIDPARTESILHWVGAIG